MHLRPTALTDEPAIGALLRAAYTELLAAAYLPAILAAALPKLVRANPRLLASGKFYAVEDTGSLLIGCGGWSHETPGDTATISGLLHLRHFATHPAHTRRGIGRLIVDRCATQAAQAGSTTFHAFSSLQAVPFYASIGLHPVRAFDLPLGENIRLPAILMAGPITPPNE